MKNFLVFAMLMFSTGFGFAQNNNEQQNYAGSSRFFDNWSIGLSGGVRTNLHTWEAVQGGHFGIELGRKITPIFGIRGTVGVGINDLSNWQGHTSHIHNGTVIDNINAYLLGTFNLTNAFLGYNGKPRVFELSAVAGVGYGHGFDSNGNISSTSVLYKDALLTRAGFDLDFNIGKERAWTVGVRPYVVFNTAGHSQYCAAHSTFNVDATVVYHFKTSNKKHYINKAVLYDYAEAKMKNNLIAQLNKENTDLRNENDALKSALVNAVNKVDTVLVEKQPEYTANVHFKKASSKIEDESEVVALAEQITAAGKKVSIFGYASSEGDENYNNNLSTQRAMVVKQALTKYVDKKLLGKAVGLGTTSKFDSGSYDANRVVIVAE